MVFNPFFYQIFWDIVAPSLVSFVTSMLDGQCFLEGLNYAFSVLIPKVDASKLLKQFRPVGLCIIVYKIVTKFIVNRIKPLLPKLISPTQCSFVPRHQITHNVIIDQEMLHTMRKNGLYGYQN